MSNETAWMEYDTMKDNLDEEGHKQMQWDAFLLSTEAGDQADFWADVFANNLSDDDGNHSAFAEHMSNLMQPNGATTMFERFMVRKLRDVIEARVDGMELE